MADKIRINKKYDIMGKYEPSDSEEYTDSEKKLLDNVRKRRRDDSDSEENVYEFSESDDSDGKQVLNMADSDVEGQEKSDDDIPDSKAWGKNKRSYYRTDYVDEDYGGFGDDEEAALMEEEEAKNIQKRLLEQLGDEDFALDFFSKKKTTSEERESVIKSDLSQLSKRQKLQLFEKESPEFAGLVDDFKTKLNVAKDNLQPVLELVKDGKLPKCPASKFVKTNYDLILNYCTNISFYLLLKTQRICIQNHPVIKVLYKYKQMLKKMEPVYLEVIKPQIDKILQAASNNIKLNVDDIASQIVKDTKKRKYDKNSSESASKKLKFTNSSEKNDAEDTGVSDDEDSDYFNGDSNSLKLHNSRKESDESGFSDNDEDMFKEHVDDNQPSTSSQGVAMEETNDKRKITYQIAKNKGLTPHRKREQRNPRVKHKLKYRKAKIRRKGSVREPKTEITRYSGEASGIKANVKKGIKIK